MATNVTGAQLAPIADRLNNIPQYHPFEANAFSDWSMEAGDIVTVSRDGTTYSSPVHVSRMTWKGGAPTVQLTSSGNKERGPIAKTSRKKYGRGSAGVRSQEGIYREFTSEDGLLHSSILMTESILRTEFDAANSTMYSVIEQTSTYVRTEVANLQSDMHSLILQTPEMVRTEVGSAVSTFAHSVIEQTSTYIRSEVANAASEISHSVIEQTVSYVRTEVASVASGIAYSVIEQTMTGIIQEVHNKSKIYIQMDDPNNGTNVLYEGDVWIQALANKTWNSWANSTWNNLAEHTWDKFYGYKHFVWRNGAWEEIIDTAAIVEQGVEIEHTKDLLAIHAKERDMDKNEFRSNLAVTAHAIRTDVTTAKSEIYSTIEQTATNIKTQVENVRAGLQSSIEQTESRITLSVSASKSELYSTIEQTATSIRMEVSSAKSDLYSSIQQTASEITLSVSAAKSSLYSTIMQTATSIRLQVVGKNGVISAINQSSEQIDIEASRINLSGYVTASVFNSTKAKIDNLVSGVTRADYIKTYQLLVADNYFTIANRNARWRSFVLNGTTHHYLGYD